MIRKTNDITKKPKFKIMTLLQLDKAKKPKFITMHFERERERETVIRSSAALFPSSSYFSPSTND